MRSHSTPTGAETAMRACFKAVLGVFLTLSACNFGGCVAVKNVTSCDQQCGASEHNTTQLEMFLEEEAENYDSGLFLLPDPIPINGTILTVSASGYCTVVNRTSQPFRLRVVFYNGRSRIPDTSATVPADCDTSTSDQDVNIGSIEARTSIEVKAGNYLGMRFNPQCNEQGGRCTFRPATVDTDMQQYLYLNSSDSNYRTLPNLDEMVRVTGLQFSFLLRENSKECSQKPPPDKLYIVVIAVLSAVIVLVVFAFSSVFLFKARRKRQTSLVGHHAATNRYAQENQEPANNFLGSAENGTQHLSTSTATQEKERKDSVTYDYAREEEVEFKLATLASLPDGHYGFDAGSSDEPFWEPVSAESELKNQLQDLSLTQDILSVVSQSQETAGVVYETVGEVGATTGPATSENVAYGVPDTVPTSHNPAYSHLPTKNVASQSQETPGVVYETVGGVGATTGPATSENVAYGVPDTVPTSHNPAYAHLPTKK